MTLLQAEVSYRNLVNQQAESRLEKIGLIKSGALDETQGQILLEDQSLLDEATLGNLVAEETNNLIVVESENVIFLSRRDMLLQELKTRFSPEEVAEADIEKLIEIAELCPDIYGDVVYSAQFLLMYHDVNHLVTDDPCEAQVDGREAVQLDRIRDDIKIYPNPAGRKITVTSEIEEESHIRILTTSGVMVISKPFTGQQLDIDIRNLNSGIYFVEISRLDEEPIIKRIMVQN